MIYFDNAATTRRKPPGVAEAINARHRLVRRRGARRARASIDAPAWPCTTRARQGSARLWARPRRPVCRSRPTPPWRSTSPSRGFLPAGGRAVTTAASHNSVLRPLFKSRDERQVHLLAWRPSAPDGALDFAAYERLLEERRRPRGGHASNLTGDVYDVTRRASRTGRRCSCSTPAQTGALPLDMGALGADIVCFTGHKKACTGRRERAAWPMAEAWTCRRFWRAAPARTASTNGIRASCPRRWRPER